MKGPSLLSMPEIGPKSELRGRGDIGQILKKVFYQLGLPFPRMKAEIETELVAGRCDTQACVDRNLLIRIVGGHDEDDSV